LPDPIELEDGRWAVDIKPARCVFVEEDDAREFNGRINEAIFKALVLGGGDVVPPGP